MLAEPSHTANRHGHHHHPAQSAHGRLRRRHDSTTGGHQGIIISSSDSNSCRGNNNSNRGSYATLPQTAITTTTTTTTNISASTTSAMSRRGLFGWKKNLAISEQDPSYKVRYLGNVQTSLMKGEGCVDRPVGTIWSNYLRCPHPGVEMKLVLTASGLKAYTKEQGLTEYRAHRISYCIAHPAHPRLFVWVYRHEARRLKMELRCHAVLCRSEVKAKAMALQLHEKLTQALQEFQREKLRKQNSRLVLLRTNSVPKAGSVLPLRKQLLSTANNFRPPASKSTGAPKLGDIHEDHEGEEEDSVVLAQELEEEEEEEEGVPPDIDDPLFSPHLVLDALNLDSPGAMANEDFHSAPFIDVEMGNDIEQLRCDRDVQFCVREAATADSDEESAESGFHDQEERGQGAVEEEAGGGGGQEGPQVMLNPIGDEDDEEDDEEEEVVKKNPTS